RYFYDISGDIIAFSYNGDYYYYLKNLQNDIIAIADENGNIVGEYSYDAFGRVELSYGTIAQINPFWFKSYYYDVETFTLLY
ncbi:MAG: hypothetical protein PHX62_06335, partial [Bacilli bacterium]|nr:hypothetical protein [Bacilli bacterium]